MHKSLQLAQHADQRHSSVNECWAIYCHTSTRVGYRRRNGKKRSEVVMDVCALATVAHHVRCVSLGGGLNATIQRRNLGTCTSGGT